MTVQTADFHQIRPPAPKVELPPELRERVVACTKKYPKSRSGLLAALYELQYHFNHVPDGAIGEVADIFGLSAAEVQGVVSFYTMYYRQPVGKFVIQFCRTLPCHLRGAGDLRDEILKELGIGIGETTKDGLFTAIEVECIGACADAPALLLNDDLHDNLDAGKVKALIGQCRAGK